MIEWIFILSLCFIVLVIFYKQANDEFTILQLEGNQLVNLPSLLSEKNPIVIRQVQQPLFFTPEAILQNQRIQTFPLEQGAQLKDGLQSSTARISPSASSILAQEIGLQVWADHTWLPYMSTMSFLYFMKTFARMGEAPLIKTTAVATLLLPTSQPLEVAILTGAQEKFLPKQWWSVFPETLTANDTPLVGSIKYIIVKVKPGNALCLPPHWFYSIRASDPKKAMLYAEMQVHHPLSWVAQRLETNHTESKN